MNGLDKEAMVRNLSFLARQHQEPGMKFASITEQPGQNFVLYRLREDKFNLVVLDNFSTLGEVEDENAASSFNAIQQFMLQLKTAQVAMILVHHTGKAEDNFRGSSKLAATFESIIQLERPDVAHRDNRSHRTRVTADPGKACFRVKWDKLRSGGSRPKSCIAAGEEQFGADPPLTWEFFETGETLDELAQLLPQGEFRSQKEIGDYFGVSPMMGGKYVKKGIAYGLWTEQDVARGLALGKKLRNQGKTEAPVPPDNSWREEPLSEEELGETKQPKDKGEDSYKPVKF
jgi:hypothetical protein